jgi:hypothetical protein
MYPNCVVLSCDDAFYSCAKDAAACWRAVCPGIYVQVILVKNEDYPREMDLVDHALVVRCPKGIPLPNAAKLARHWFASTMTRKTVCMIEDADILPISRKFIEEIMSHYEDGKAICVGRNVYKGTKHEGKFPMSSMTASSNVFAAIYNPRYLPFNSFVNSFVGLREFDAKEDPSHQPDRQDGWYQNAFSDESLTRALIHKHNIEIIDVDRNPNYLSIALDRSKWSLDFDRILKGGVIQAHLPRPFDKHQEDITKLRNFIIDMYTKGNVR